MKKSFNVMYRLALGLASVLWLLFFLSAVTLQSFGFHVSMRSQVFAAFAFLSFAALPAMMVFCIVDTYRNQGIRNDKKGLWAALLFFGNMVVVPVYWYKYIWRVKNRMPETPIGEEHTLQSS